MRAAAGQHRLAGNRAGAYIGRMYRLCLQRDFSARHRLVGGDWGAENAPHAHDYRIEWELRAEGLDRHGFLVDLLDVGRSLDGVVERFRDALLNDLPEFADANPSLERFVKILWERLAVSLPPKIECAVRLWENESAWAGYEQARQA
jgi:6-pyruvoyltetrahydropterin/6-carboxytetrahydropterin synthase